MEDAEKLSVRLREITDLLREADHWAREVGRGVIGATDVQAAIDAKIFRSDQLRERLQESIQRGTMLIDTRGERVGQVNGLSMVDLGNFMFGHPIRTTASVRLGRGEVLDIQREVELSGPIHSKGALILSGFLGARYAPERPLAQLASLVFEQTCAGRWRVTAPRRQSYTACCQRWPKHLSANCSLSQVRSTSMAKFRRSAA